MYPARPASEAVNQFRISRQSEPGHHENSGDGKISVNPERNRGGKGEWDSGDRRAGWQTGRQVGWQAGRQAGRQASRAEGAGFHLRLKELPVKGKSLPLPPSLHSPSPSNVRGVREGLKTRAGVPTTVHRGASAAHPANASSPTRCAAHPRSTANSALLVAPRSIRD